MTSRALRTATAFSAAALLLGAAACSSSGGSGDPLGAKSPTASAGGKTVVVGSANFPENVLLASIYSQALKAKGVKVEEKFNIGSREVLYGQLESGALSVLPEYNGALLSYLDPKTTAAGTQAVNAALLQKLPASLTVLDSAAAEDKDSLTVSQATADAKHLKTIADLAAAGPLAVGGPPEFKSRKEQQFKDAYQLTFKEWKPTGDTTANAIKDGTVDVGNVFTTDPKIVQLKLVTLEDPKNVFSSQNVTPLVNKSAVDATTTATLNAVSGKLDTAGLTALMKRVAVDKDDPSAVAKDWLKANGLA